MLKRIYFWHIENLPDTHAFFNISGGNFVTKPNNKLQLEATCISDKKISDAYPDGKILNLEMYRYIPWQFA